RTRARGHAGRQAARRVCDRARGSTRRARADGTPQGEASGLHGAVGVVVLDHLPLTPNGKVDRKALPAPDWTGGLDRTYVAPRSPAEELLAGIWVQVLHLERVGVEDNFFELGGHSLLATQVASRVRQSFGV